MFFNKNGLKINLNFDQSLDENEISKNEPININKNIIRKESTIYFSHTSKSIKENTKKEEPKLLRKSSYNFPIISKIKIRKDFIINKTSKFQILKSTKIIQPKKNIFEIIKSNNINIIIPKKIVETEINKDIKEEKKVNSIIEKKIFLNLNSFNINNIFIKGKKKDRIIDIQKKINDIKLPGKPRRKSFESVNISSKVNDITIEQHKFLKESEIKPCEAEKIEIKQKKNITQDIPKVYNIESKNEISFKISGISKLKEEKIFSMQNNIINFEIIQKSKNIFKNLTKKRIINFDIKPKIKKKKKKSPHLIFRKVEGFNNINNKIFNNDMNNKEILINDNVEDNNIIDKKIDENKKEIKSKINKIKAKSPNKIEIKIKNNNHQDDINLNLNDENNNNNSNKLKINKIITSNKDNKSRITINTINNEIIYNKQSINVPVINTDILHFEEQYEKIKKDLNELYPIIHRNKKYRENFFMQLSQGNQDKYNFYLDLYKIIKDEQDEKNNNNLENYLKMKKIVGNKNIALQNNKLIRNKLRPLKKNKSSHFIFSKDKIKIKPLFTDFNY